MKKLMVGIAAVVGVAVIGVVYFSSARYSGPPQDEISFEQFKGPTGSSDLERALTRRYPPGTSAEVLQKFLTAKGAPQQGCIPGSSTAEIEQLERSWLKGRKLRYDATDTLCIHKKAVGVWSWMMVVVVRPNKQIADIAVYGA